MHVLKDDFSPERIPTLEEFVDEAVKLGMKVILDLKTYKQPEETTKVGKLSVIHEKEILFSKKGEIGNFY